MSKIKVLVFAGSVRKDSFNKRLARIAVNQLESIGTEVTYIDLKDYSIPLYDGDIEVESGIPENAKKIKSLLIDHDAAIIVTPEYNSSYPALLKNVIDWCSRPEQGEKSLLAYAGKVMAIMSASPGALGGLRSLAQLRTLLGNMQVIVIPEQFALSSANQAFSDNGDLIDEKNLSRVKVVVDRLVKVTTSLKQY